MASPVMLVKRSRFQVRNQIHALVTLCNTLTSDDLKQLLTSTELMEIETAKNHLTNATKEFEENTEKMLIAARLQGE